MHPKRCHRRPDSGSAARTDHRRSDLTVELLSYRFHGTRQAFEADVARRRRSGHVAYTYGDVFERAAQTAAELAARIATARP